jgi:hypothetical protein
MNKHNDDLGTSDLFLSPSGPDDAKPCYNRYPDDKIDWSFLTQPESGFMEILSLFGFKRISQIL